MRVNVHTYGEACDWKAFMIWRQGEFMDFRVHGRATWVVMAPSDSTGRAQARHRWLRRFAPIVSSAVADAVFLRLGQPTRGRRALAQATVDEVGVPRWLWKQARAPV